MATEETTKLVEPQSQSKWTQPGPSATIQIGEPRSPGLQALTEEEILVMKECDRDSFYKRAMPLSFGSMLGAQMLVRGGYWNPHPKYGSLPKVIIFGGIGYFIGKISYVPVCQQKILEKIPNSNLAAAIRKAKGLPEVEVSSVPWEGAALPSSRIKDDYSAPEGLDDRFRPTLDRDVKEPESSTHEKSSVTYEELRRRNRQEYKDQLSKSPPKAPGTPKPWPDAKSGETLELPSSPPTQAPSAKKRTNIWGDPIDD